MYYKHDANLWFSDLWYQPASGQWLQAERGRDLRWWPEHETSPRHYSLCEQQADIQPNCRMQVVGWSAHWVQIHFYAHWPETEAELMAAPPAGPVRHVVLNLKTAQIEHLLTLEPADPASLYPVCLNTKQWAFLTGSEDQAQLVLWDQTEQTQQHWPLSATHAGVYCIDHQILLAEREANSYALSWRLPGSPVSWPELGAESWQRLAVSPAYELYQHKLYDHLIRKARDPAIPTAYLMPETYLVSCQQADRLVYCQNTQGQWSVLKLDETPLQMRQLNILLPFAAASSEQGIKLGNSQLFQQQKRRVYHLALSGGRLWITDQGHYFRQGEISAAEMPYLVDGLKTLDLPAHLESWPEVQRALQGLSPLSQQRVPIWGAEK